MKPRHSIPCATALLLSMLALAGAGGASERAVHAKPPAASVPRLAWQPCAAPAPGLPSLEGFECATATVPLDHAKPAGRQISLGVIRHRARVPAIRAGVLFFNPGGPGDQGSVFLPPLLGNFDARVLDRFDLVSWDPRGMGGMSSPVVQCFDNAADEETFLRGVSFPPASVAERDAYAERLAAFNRRCGGRDDELLAHVSTADNARDLDLLRQAFGEPLLRYYGTSYGTFLGNTYANMFPDRVGAMVLDGAVDPVDWTRGGPPSSTFVRVGSDRASAQVLAAFLKRCAEAGPSRCAFAASDAADTSAKFDQLLARAASAPIVLDPGDPPLRRSDVLGVTLGSLYLVRPLEGFDRFIGWAALADLLQTLWKAPAGASAVSPAAAAPTAPAAGSPRAPYSGMGRQPAVICGESPNPRTAGEALANATVAERRAGIGGATWPWIGFCPGWPVRASAPYPGPFDRVKKPVLVIGTTGDPATPYDNAVSTARRLPGGVLLTVDGFGHTALANPSACAQSYVAAYLVDGTLPPRGARCAQDAEAFAATNK